MGYLVEEDGVLVYKLEASQPNDLHRLPKELVLGRKKTVGGKTGIILTRGDIKELRNRLEENNINGDTLKDMCDKFYWHMLDNLEEEEFFFTAEYKERRR